MYPDTPNQMARHNYMDDIYVSTDILEQAKKLAPRRPNSFSNLVISIQRKGRPTILNLFSPFRNPTGRIQHLSKQYSP